jgi:carbonic anhydrase
MTISRAGMLDETYQRCVAALSAEQAGGSEQNDVLAADAATLANVEQVVQGVIKEIKHD